MEEAPVTALTPDCDPDLSHHGPPPGRPGLLTVSPRVNFLSRWVKR